MPSEDTTTTNTYFVLRNGLDLYHIVADRVDDPTGRGTPLNFTLGGTTVGSVSGDIRAWWIDSGDFSNRYIIETTLGYEISVNADEWENVPDEFDYTVFKKDGEIVGATFDLDWYAWKRQ